MPETSSETLMARRIILQHDDALRAPCLASIVLDSKNEADEDMPTGIYDIRAARTFLAGIDTIGNNGMEIFGGYATGRLFPSTPRRRPKLDDCLSEIHRQITLIIANQKVAGDADRQAPNTISAARKPVRDLLGIDMKFVKAQARTVSLPCYAGTEHKSRKRRVRGRSSNFRSNGFEVSAVTSW
ncbi:hypothetical protein LTR87_013816 [Friedmanniomyces endolithicus]|nr:hypothetical protein LTR87_013816 [Friedmanniomyces endolithicus]